MQISTLQDKIFMQFSMKGLWSHDLNLSVRPTNSILSLCKTIAA